MENSLLTKKIINDKISKYILIFCYDDNNNEICNSINKLNIIDLNYSLWNKEISFYKNNVYCPELYSINDDADIYKLNYNRIINMSFLEKCAYVLNLLFKIYDLKEYVYSDNINDNTIINEIYDEFIRYKKIVLFDRKEYNKKLSIKYITQPDDYVDCYRIWPIGSIFKINYENKDEKIKIKKNIFYNQNKFIQNYKYHIDKNFDKSLIFDENRDFILSNKIYQPFGDYIYSIIIKENINIINQFDINWLINNWNIIKKNIYLKILDILLDNYKVIDYVYDEICKIYCVLNEEINKCININIKEILLILSSGINQIKEILDKLK